MAIDFDSVDGRVSLGSPSSLDNIFAGGGTIMAWINIDGFGEGSAGRILAKESNNIAGNGYNFAVSSSPAVTLVRGFSGTRGGWRTPASSISTGTLFHVAVTYDEDLAANDPAIYIDGVSQSITEISTPVGTASSDAAQTAAIGDTIPGTDRTFDGRIEDMRMYNRILSAAEIQTIFAAQGVDGIVSGLVGRWMLDEAAPGVTASGAGTAKDIGSLGNDGEPLGSPTYAASEIRSRRRVS